MVHINNSWDELLKEDFNSENYLELREMKAKECQSRILYQAKLSFKKGRN